MRPMKPRSPGTLHAAVRSAAEELGYQTAADLVERSESWVHSAGDPDRDPNKAANLTYAQARAWSRGGATALASDLAVLAGGAFLPVSIDPDLDAAHAAVAAFSLESGEAVSAIVQCVADGKLCAADARKSIPQIDDALRALMALRSVVVAASDTANRP